MVGSKRTCVISQPDQLEQPMQTELECPWPSAPCQLLDMSVFKGWPDRNAIIAGMFCVRLGKTPVSHKTSGTCMFH